VHQDTLTGIPHAESARLTSRRGPRKSQAAKPQEQKLLGLYSKDVRALQALVSSGYAKNATAVIRRAIREAASFEKAGFARTSEPETLSRSERLRRDGTLADHKLIWLYTADLAALEALAASGYGANASAIVRRALADAAAFEQIRLARQQEERLEL
jgi:Arc/MetJ-type ribon-helix-helix transcriptional regulator